MASRELSISGGFEAPAAFAPSLPSRSSEDGSTSATVEESSEEEQLPLCEPKSTYVMCGLRAEEAPSEAPRANRALRPVLAATLVLALVACGIAAFPIPSAGEVPALRPTAGGTTRAEFVPAPAAPQPPAPPARQLTLFQSPELRRAVVDQLTAFSRMSFHGRRTSEVSNAREENLPEGEELEAAVDEELHNYIDELAARHPNIAATLNSTNVTQEHWESVRRVLKGVSDPRVIDIGLGIAHALGGDYGTSGGRSLLSEGARRRVNASLTSRTMEMRQLREEFIPASVQDLGPDGADHWDAVISSQGVQVLGQVGHWRTELDVTLPSHEARSLTAGRRLSVIRLVIGSSIATVFSVLTTVLTAVFGAPMARFIWSMQGLAAVATCLAEIFTLMIPCMIEAGFFGIEAIWVWLK